jgi:DNA-binding winged helix-turn-helix (wHTH) protein
VNGRYFDALVLLVRDHGRLISKDRFLEEVWRGVPVTDEALTQCVRTLRRQLGDDASRPRFIETIPKHGYRFIAPVEAIGGKREEARGDSEKWLRFVSTGAPLAVRRRSRVSSTKPSKAKLSANFSETSCPVHAARRLRPPVLLHQQHRYIRVTIPSGRR